MNILIILNTNYHVETALSVYESLKLRGDNPTILLNYTYHVNDPNLFDYNLKEFLTKYDINFITEEDYYKKYRNIFDYGVLVSSNNCLKNSTPADLPPNFNPIMEDFKDNMVLIYHRANYTEYIEHANKLFNKPKAISVTNFSQKYNLDYIFQIENPVARYYKKEFYTQNKNLKFLILGRFCLKNRNLEYINQILDLDKELNQQIEIFIIGQKPYLKDIEQFNFLNKKYENIKLFPLFDIDESEFYSYLGNCDYLLNLVDFKHGKYFTERTTSNITHTIAFEKPSLCFMPLNLIYNMPCIEYISSDFKQQFTKCLDMTNENYHNMILSFNTIKNNMRAHNEFIFSKIFS